MMNLESLKLIYKTPNIKVNPKQRHFSCDRDLNMHNRRKAVLKYIIDNKNSTLTDLDGELNYLRRTLQNDIIALVGFGAILSSKKGNRLMKFRFNDGYTGEYLS